MNLRSLPLFLLIIALPLSADDGTIEFSADTMSGTSGKARETTVLEGNARVRVGSLSISGDRIELSGKDFRYVKASGGVKGEDTDKGFSFSSDEVDYDRDSEIAVLRGRANLKDSKNDVSADASLITYNRKTEVALLQVGVHLVRRNIDCSSGFALYRRAVSLLELSGNPLVKRDSDEFRANRISVDLDTERISLDGSVSGSLKESPKDEGPKSDNEPPTPVPGEPVAEPAGTDQSVEGVSGE